MLTILLLGAVASSTALVHEALLTAITNCTTQEFRCRNGDCILSRFRCDGNNNCEDASDEEDCEFALCKQPKYFRCKNHRCISNVFVCDGENDCDDFSDEVNCKSFKLPEHTNSTCEEGHWQCTDKLCIPEEWVCNGEPDCLDSSDEGIGCSSKIKCDAFKCNNGHCIPNEWRCDGQNDCHDNSDEQDCENQYDISKCNLDERKFLCANNKTCINLNKICDNQYDCPDNSDEGILCSRKSSCANYNCSHDCVYLSTGPTCLCPIGYKTDGKLCIEINECEIYGICDQKCRNTPGSYECYCDKKYKLQGDKKTCKVERGEAMMVFSSKTEIRAYSLDSEVYFPIARHLKQVIGIDYDGQHIYWTNIFAEHESIVRSTEDGSTKETLITSGLGLPEDLAVDWLTGNIYFTDAEKQHIGVCTKDGSHCTILVNKDIHKPRGIVLNVAEGDMYWSDWGKAAEIAYSLMDGSKDVSFVSEDIHWPNGLAIDYPNERLYWTDARKMTLESIRLDGTDRRIVLEGVVKHPYAIAVFENRLYWSDWATHSIQSCDKFSGKNHHTIIKEAKQYIYGLSIFHSALHFRSANPCVTAFCSDMCLLKGPSGYSCACPQNKELSPNKYTCHELTKQQLLIVGVNNMLIHVKHQLLGKQDITNLPTIVKTVGCLTFDNLNNTLLISDLGTKKIISTNLNTGISKRLDINGLEKVIAMDYDPMGNNLYMCDEDRGVLEVVNLNTMSKKILLHDLNGEVPEAIVLVPDEGVMFVAFSKKHGRISHIDRIYMDGTGRTHFIDYGLIGPISLTYDSELHRIFFADAGTGNVESISMKGDDRRSFRSLSTSPIGLTSLNQDIFWINENSRRLFWASKNSTLGYSKKITLDISGEIGRMHITSATPRKTYRSACYINNGNCSHLCLMSHKATVCACPVGWDLTENNHTCIKKEQCNVTEYLCPHSRICIVKSLRCNGYPDCAYGEDEEGCEETNKCALGYFQCGNGDCIEEQHVCDHNYDCKNKSDEHNCEEKIKKRMCPPLHFTCDDGNCIAERFLCDGDNDCEDHSDEQNCVSTICELTQFRCDTGACIPKSWECDHEYDCTDFSDEHAQCSSVTCSPNMHTCSNGKCIEKKLVCDTVDDCGDGSDEEVCHADTQDGCTIDEFACESNKSICLLNSAKCNGTSECPHHEDEKDCSDCRVHEFPCDNKKCISVQWLCDGRDDCGDKTDEKAELCSHYQNGVVDTVVHTSCESGFRCKSGHCIDMNFVCDGKQHCYDGSDEDGLCSTACEPSRNPCPQDCVSTPTGPLCKCKPGFRLMGDGYTCQDINECQNDPPVCSQICNNVEGSYICDCFNGFMLRSDKISCKAEGLPMSLIFVSDNQIRILSQKSNSLRVLYAEDMPKITGLDVVQQTNHVYFSIETTGTIHRFDSKTQIRQYIKYVGQPQKIAVDWPTHNIYFYHAGSDAKSINVCNFYEMLCAKLIDIDVHRQVSAIAIDSVNNVMFYSLTSWWIFNNPSYVVYKRNLDGSGSHELIKSSTGRITGLTFDCNKKHLYYIDQHNRQIGVVNYEGTVNSLLFTIQANPRSLKFLENHLYYFTSGGYVAKCKLFDTRECDTFKLQSFSGDLVTIVQESLQPKLENVCKNHTCDYLCLSVDSQYKCLCRDGSVVLHTEKCPTLERDSENVGEHKIYSVPVVSVHSKTKKNSGMIVVAVLIPILILVLVAAIIFIIKRRNRGSFNVSMKFYNPAYENEVDDEKSILQPGQHEYTNPVHFNRDESEIPSSVMARKLNEYVVD